MGGQAQVAYNAFPSWRFGPLVVYRSARCTWPWSGPTGWRTRLMAGLFLLSISAGPGALWSADGNSEKHDQIRFGVLHASRRRF